MDDERMCSVTFKLRLFLGLLKTLDVGKKCALKCTYSVRVIFICRNIYFVDTEFFVSWTGG